MFHFTLRLNFKDRCMIRGSRYAKQWYIVIAVILFWKNSCKLKNWPVSISIYWSV
ncbi:Uncharacterised protein [Vibrio cholerae]|nr:Uncharacterised protein [Vibrio cholerae]CSI28700.1 Uncharacterised protein [Vibrio cholerae]